MNGSDTITILQIRLRRAEAVERKLRDDIEDRERLLVVTSDETARTALRLEASVAEARELIDGLAASRKECLAVRADAEAKDAEARKRIAALERHNRILSDNGARLAERLRARGRKE